MTTLSIGEVAARSGTPATTLRYYESIGLVLPIERQGGRRRYAESALARLHAIGLCRQAGFSLDEIGILLAASAADRAAGTELAIRKLAEIDEQRRRLDEAEALIHCGLACTCPSIEECACGAADALLTDLPPVDRRA